MLGVLMEFSKAASGVFAVRMLLAEFARIRSVGYTRSAEAVTLLPKLRELIVLPEVIFTDGAVEDSGASCGGVPFSRHELKVLYFGFGNPAAVLDHWRDLGSHHAVEQCKPPPSLAARLAFKRQLAGAKVLYLVDNEAVKEALDRGSAGALAVPEA